MWASLILQQELRCLWYLVSHALFAKCQNHMLKGMKLSCMVIANTVLFANISDFLKCVFVYIMTFSIVHRDT